MLTAPNRLSNSRDIARVYSRGRYVAADALSLKCVQTHKPRSRAVVVVSKKVSKRATVRNRIRRRLAAQLAEQWQTVASGYDIVITVRSDISEAPGEELRRNLLAVLKRSQLTT